MPMTRQVAMMRTAISPRLAMSIFLNILYDPVGLAFLKKRLYALLSFGAGAQASEGFGGVAAGGFAIHLTDVEGESFAGPYRHRPAFQQRADFVFDSLVQFLGAGDDMYQTDFAGVGGAEEFAG